MSLSPSLWPLWPPLWSPYHSTKNFFVSIFTTFWGKLFKGGNYSRVEASFCKGLKRGETIQRRKLNKGGYYTMKYSISVIDNKIQRIPWNSTNIKKFSKIYNQSLKILKKFCQQQEWLHSSFKFLWKIFVPACFAGYFSIFVKFF